MALHRPHCPTCQHDRPSLAITIPNVVRLLLSIPVAFITGLAPLHLRWTRPHCKSEFHVRIHIQYFLDEKLVEDDFTCVITEI